MNVEHFWKNVGCLVVLCGLGFVAWGQNTDFDVLLKEEAWQDYAHGLSVRTPLDAAVKSHPANELLLSVVGPGQTFLVTLKVITAEDSMSLAAFIKLAHEQLVKTHDSAVTIPQSEPTFSGGLGRVRYYQLIPIQSMRDTIRPLNRRDHQANEMIYARGVLQVNPRDFAVFEFYCDIADVKLSQPVFEAMLNSVAIANLKEIDQRRAVEIERGQRLIDQIRLHELAENLPEDRRYRLLDGGKDYGYCKVVYSRVEEHSKLGIAIERSGRIVSGNKNIDTRARYFISDDRMLEMWSLSTKYKPAGANLAQHNPFPNVNNQTHTESGVRSGANIKVTVNGFNETKQYAFVMPPRGYISQAELLLLPLIVPTERATYGFYAYNHQLAKLTLRRESVIPVFDSFTLNSQPSPNELVTKSSYDSQRRLKQLDISPTKRQVPATVLELGRIWNNR